MSCTYMYYYFSNICGCCCDYTIQIHLKELLNPLYLLSLCIFSYNYYYVGSARIFYVKKGFSYSYRLGTTVLDENGQTKIILEYIGVWYNILEILIHDNTAYKCNCQQIVFIRDIEVCKEKQCIQCKIKKSTELVFL